MVVTLPKLERFVCTLRKLVKLFVTCRPILCYRAQDLLFSKLHGASAWEAWIVREESKLQNKLKRTSRHFSFHSDENCRGLLVVRGKESDTKSKMAIQRPINLLSISQEMKELQEDFISCLHFASAEEPLFIFLDSLDQFGPEDNARKLAWLPTVLPSHVKLVVSTLPNGEYECFPILQVGKDLFRIQ